MCQPALRKGCTASDSSSTARLPHIRPLVTYTGVYLGPRKQGWFMNSGALIKLELALIVIDIYTDRSVFFILPPPDVCGPLENTFKIDLYLRGCCGFSINLAFTTI